MINAQSSIGGKWHADQVDNVTQRRAEGWEAYTDMSRYVVLELQSDHLDVLAYASGRCRYAHRIPVTLGSDPAAWTGDVQHLTQSLGAVVKEQKLHDWPTHVLYHSPTQAIDLASIAVTSHTHALEAAYLSCTDALPYSSLTAVCEGVVVGQDRARDNRQTHVVVAAERDDVAGVIADLVTGAELKYVSATPVEAALLCRIASGCLKSTGHHGCTLFIGQHVSFFIGLDARKLHFARQIRLGLESIIDSLVARSMTLPDGADHQFTREEACAILFEHGVPARDTVVDAARNISGRQIIPLMQPVLQRLIVDLRQSLRFGLPAQQRDTVSVVLTGLGATLPGLAELLQEELDVPVQRDTDWPTQIQHQQPGAVGSGLDFIMQQPAVLTRLNLLPRHVTEKRRTQRTLRLLWTGAAAALLFVAVDAGRLHMQVSEAGARAEQFEDQAKNLEQIAATSDRLRTAIGAINKLNNSVNQEMGICADLPACMHELSRITPASVRFLSIDFDDADDAMRLELSGFAFDDSQDADRSEQLEQLIAQLRASPLFTDVNLGAVQVGTLGNRVGQRFTVRAQTVGIPAGLTGLEHARAQAEEDA
jgi:Tfp pilus assembly PilM family ATPase/Tfp pilus assembly protein PilN